MLPVSIWSDRREEREEEINPNLGNKLKSPEEHLLLIKLGILMNFYLAEYILTLPRHQTDATQFPQATNRKEGVRGTGSISLSGQICLGRQDLPGPSPIWAGKRYVSHICLEANSTHSWNAQCQNGEAGISEPRIHPSQGHPGFRLVITQSVHSLVI